MDSVILGQWLGVLVCGAAGVLSGVGLLRAFPCKSLLDRVTVVAGIMGLCFVVGYFFLISPVMTAQEAIPVSVFALISSLAAQSYMTLLTNRIPSVWLRNCCWFLSFIAVLVVMAMLYGVVLVRIAILISPEVK